MPVFSARSKANLETCHPDLKRLFYAVIEEEDCSIIFGHRNMAEQDKACREGRSRLPWPKSKHNKTPSLAVDAVPCPLDWNDLEAFRKLAEVVKRKARELGIKVIWGGDWKSFVDMPHWELEDESPEKRNPG